MTRPEKKSYNKKRALILMVKTGEMSIAYAMMEAERLNDENKLFDNDYDEVMEYLEGLLPVEVEENSVENTENIENTENTENTEETNLI